MRQRDRRPPHHAAGQGRGRLRRVRDDRRPGRRDQAGRRAPGAFDLAEEFGIDADRLAALGRETQLAIAAGIDALRDAGIPLVQHYKDTTRGTKLPDKWRLADALRDDTGVIFAAAFPGYGDFAAEMEAFWTERVKRARLQELREVRARWTPARRATTSTAGSPSSNASSSEHPYHFDRRFLFRMLSMGHSQLAELIGARGPNTQVNAACASTTQALAVAEDWIRTGRCRRVLDRGRRRRDLRGAAAVDRLGLPGRGRRGDRRGRRGGRAAVRSRAATG